MIAVVFQQCLQCPGGEIDILSVVELVSRRIEANVKGLVVVECPGSFKSAGLSSCWVVDSRVGCLCSSTLKGGKDRNGGLKLESEKTLRSVGRGP
jgi:hypothetical protein